ncbi:MAG TPA: hypothetical protein VF067_05150 [Sphingomicrobium sp.]
MLKRLCLAAAALFAASPALAQVTTIETSNPLPKHSSDPDKLICERVERTGSRLQVEKVCLTAQQWSDHKYGHRADLEKVQRIVNQNSSH